jgi:hypothetical protein
MRLERTVASTGPSAWMICESASPASAWSTADSRRPHEQSPARNEESGVIKFHLWALACAVISRMYDLRKAAVTIQAASRLLPSTRQCTRRGRYGLESHQSYNIAALY